MRKKILSRKNIVSGLVAGIIAGIVVGFLMLRMAMFSHISEIVGMHDPLSGLVIHLVKSAILGIIFALIFFKYTKSFFASATWGIGYGVILWFVWTLTIVPMMTDQPVSWGTDAMMQKMYMLIGYLVFGLVLGVSYHLLRNRKDA